PRRRADLPDAQRPNRQGVLAVLAALFARRRRSQPHRRPGHRHRRLPARLLGRGQYLQGPRALRRQPAQVAVQLDGSTLRLVAHEAATVRARPHPVEAAVVVLVVEELEGVAAAVTEVDPGPIRRPAAEGLAAALPQAALAVAGTAALGAGLVLGTVTAGLEDLVGQTQR